MMPQNQQPSRIYEGLRMRFDLDNLSQCTLLSASSYQSEGSHKYFTMTFLEHCMHTIIASICFPYTIPPEDSRYHSATVKRSYEDSVFYLVEREYQFQRESVLNIAEDIILTMLCMFTRHFPEDRIIQEFDEELLAYSFMTVAEYHGKLFDDYVNWGVHVGYKHMFPWKDTQLPYRWCQWKQRLSHDQRLQAEAVMLMFEIVLYRTIWGESSCVRHMPECLNFLFRWGVVGWTDNESTTEPSFFDMLTVLSQRIRNEQCNGVKRGVMIDHKDRLHYDDLNELFWTNDCLKWLDDLAKTSKKSSASDSRLLLRYSPANMDSLLKCLTRTVLPNEGRKTFTEIRSYMFVFLSFYRVIYLHVLWFPATWALYRYLNGGESEVYQALVTLLPVGLIMLKSLVELFIGALSGCHRRTKKSWSMWQFIKIFSSFALCAYVCLFYYLYGVQGRCFKFASIEGILVAWPVLIIYAVKEARFFLYCLSKKQVANRSSISRRGKLVGFFRRFSFWKTDDFVGRKAQLAQPIGDVLFYDLLWIMIWSIKTVYWIFMMCPIVNESIAYLDMVTLRPFYVANVAVVTDLGKTVFWCGVWVPTFAMYFYDSQVIFLLFLSVIATAEGFGRRVGYMKDVDRIRKQLLPFLPTLPFVAATVPTVNETNVNAATRSSHHHAPSNRQINGGMTVGGTGREALSNAYWLGLNDADDMVMKRQRLFAFFWNNIVKDWRSEDIISNEQMHSLFFDEVPALPSRSMVDLVPKGNWWKTSNIRLPLHVVWDVVTTFVDEATAYSKAVDQQPNNKSERRHLHKVFFEKHFNQKDIFNSASVVSLHFIVGMELEEVFRDIIDNCFEDGEFIIHGYTIFVSWALLNWRNIVHVNFLAIASLRNVVIDVLKAFVSFEERPLIRGALLAQKTLPNVLRSFINQTPDSPWLSDDAHPVAVFLESINLLEGSTIVAPGTALPLPLVRPKEVENVVSRIKHAAVEDILSNLPQALLDKFLLNGEKDSLALSTIAFGSIDMNKAIIESRQALKTVEVLQSGPECIRSLHYARFCLYQRGLALLSGKKIQPLVKEATRRMVFFLNTLVMKIPETPCTTHMRTLCTLTPYYREEVETDLKDMYDETSEGIRKMDLLRTLFGDEFNYFLERCDTPEGRLWNLHQRLEMITRSPTQNYENDVNLDILAKEIIDHDLVALLAAFRRSLGLWVTFRGQTLLRTIRGQMHIEEALHMQSHLDSIGGKCHGAIPGPSRLPQVINKYQPILGNWTSEIAVKSIYQFNEAAALRARLNYTYVVAAQEFGNDRAQLDKMKAAKNSTQEIRANPSATRALKIISAMKLYPSLAVVTLENELDPSGVPTGFKMSSLYRWSQTSSDTSASKPLATMKTNLTLFKPSTRRNKKMTLTSRCIPLEVPQGVDSSRSLLINSSTSPSVVTRTVEANHDSNRNASRTPIRAMEDPMTPVLPDDESESDQLYFGDEEDTLSLDILEPISTSQPPDLLFEPTVDDGAIRRIYSVRQPAVVDEDGVNWPRYPVVGPGKPENQNHACIFARGELIQAIDMNMDFHLEEAVKVRNLLQEFAYHPEMAILGFREHVFTIGVSSISDYMALQEKTFVTNSQRGYAHPLRARMHYGHPDIFDRFFTITQGGMSKSSNGLHLSEDVFAGFNAVMRGRTIRHVDYVHAGKGRDVGLNQISMFEKKVSSGNGEQMLSRDNALYILYWSWVLCECRRSLLSDIPYVIPQADVVLCSIYNTYPH
eukprot:GHVH01009487.1.p1 GENE.GHVH01009487.1~~GHVH01009487.1.p1  ORF type:complete len:1740 (+),score=202.61 GHVH01009487.1:126-5345(+)